MSLLELCDINKIASYEWNCITLRKLCYINVIMVHHINGIASLMKMLAIDEITLCA